MPLGTREGRRASRRTPCRRGPTRSKRATTGTAVSP
jgi:hypothetical protein